MKFLLHQYNSTIAHCSLLIAHLANLKKFIASFPLKAHSFQLTNCNNES